LRKRILLADDSTTIHRLVSATFESKDGFDVFAVESGDAALLSLDDVRPDVVLTDIVMPGKTGYEVCREIRAHAAFGRVPVILLVGAFDRLDPAHASEAGAAAFIQKPFEPEALCRLVASVIETSEEIRSAPSDEDLLGLGPLFPPVPPERERRALTVAEIEMIADRVLARLSTEVIESVAWDVVPEIAERVVRDEIQKRHDD
jgi:DNA-binding response OmpR family regulator